MNTLRLNHRAEALPQFPQRLTGLRRAGAMVSAPFRFFTRVLLSDVRLERDGRNVRIQVAAPLPEIDPQQRAIAEAAPMSAALKGLLDIHHQTRNMTRHLAYLDSMLATQGLRALTEVPVEVLAQSLQQLESIVSNWSDPHLAALRSRMAVAVHLRRDAQVLCAADERPPLPSIDPAPTVEEVSESDFLALERQYQGLLSQDEIDASLKAAKMAK